ncbi:probable E3 ubiquitin-protein ligase MID2 [Haliotis asinina]|uniref:probable E3 ubiquitin-protein ligase MID2 n=1 Tax=Haliotis asinina TaxID=109174 RepID=UPI0035318BFD
MDDDMRRQLSCSVCLDLYTEPLLLPCLHSLCRQCVHSLVSSLITECPECKNEIPRNLSTLPKNFPLSSMVAIYKQSMTHSSRSPADNVSTRVSGEQEQTTGNTVTSSGQRSWSSYEPSFNRQCSTCDPGNNTPSEIACLTGSIAFCAPCLEEYHPKDNSHALVSLEEVETTTNCAICSSSSVTTCIECEMSFCMSCLEDYHPTTSSAPGHTLRSTDTQTTSRHSGSVFLTGGLEGRQLSQPCPPQAQTRDAIGPSAPPMSSLAQSYHSIRSRGMQERGQATLSVGAVTNDRHIQEELLQVHTFQQRVILELLEAFEKIRHET